MVVGHECGSLDLGEQGRRRRVVVRARCRELHISRYFLDSFEQQATIQLHCTRGRTRTVLHFNVLADSESNKAAALHFSALTDSNSDSNSTRSNADVLADSDSNSIRNNTDVLTDSDSTRNIIAALYFNDSNSNSNLNSIAPQCISRLELELELNAGRSLHSDTLGVTRAVLACVIAERSGALYFGLHAPFNL